MNIFNLEDNSTKDDNLVDDAKRKVGQAKADTQEAQKQIEKANAELTAIKDELENLRDISTDDLDKLGKQVQSLKKRTVLLIISSIQKIASLSWRVTSTA